jgi:16S rRNA processing protein RimM
VSTNGDANRAPGRRVDATPPPGWLAIGHLRRPHGLRGDIFVQLTTDRTDRVEPGAEVFGAGVFHVIETSRRAGNGRIIAKLHGVDDRTAAERLTNTALFAAPVDDPDALWVHEMIGARVVDQHGVDHGACTAVVANPAADLIEVDTGALVPSTFVTSFADGVISVEVPVGLFAVQLDDGYE